MKKFLLLALGFSFSMFFSQHKFLETPKLSDEDVAGTKSVKDPEAAAEVLYRSFHYRVDYDGNMYTDIISRVKIYNKDNASDFLDHEIYVYDDGHGNRETLSGLKAYTYNMEKGKITTTKVDSDSKYKSKEDKNYTVTKFAFANVKNGSVVEYSYSILTPFLNSIPFVYMEDKIPVKYVEFVFDTAKPLGYNINYKGDIAPVHRDVSEKKIYGGDYQVYRFGYENLPAYKDEEFVLNNNNYRTALKAELNSIMYKDELKKYALTWKDIAKRLYDHDNFGEQLKKNNLVKEVLPADIKNISNMQEKAAAILKFVQKNYTYNKEDDVVTDKGIKNLLTTKVGNAAEINLLLTMLLRSANIDANPVVLSTVKRGFLNSASPSVSQLNFVLASIEKDGKIYLLDGTSKQSKINMVSPKAFNYYGLIMSEKETMQINIVYPGLSETFLTVDAKMTPEGTFEGHFSDRDTNLYAMMVNSIYTENKDDYQKQYKERYKFPYSNLKSGVQDNDDFETSFDFDSDTFVDTIGNRLVFNPLLFLYTQNHSYNQTQERKAPLEFYSRNKKTKKVAITLPDGYIFENVPKSKKFRTEDNAIQYVYYVEQEGNKITVEATTTIDDAILPKEYFPMFKQIFDNITQLEGQVVTAVKKL